jgi:Zn-dependent metalloprotease
MPRAVSVRVSWVRERRPSILAHEIDQYDCFTCDDHHNGTILSHAYHLLVKKAGHTIAGHVLQYVPWQLPARREFGDVRLGFENAARGLFPNGGKDEGSVEQKVDQAFAEVGVFAATRRTAKCKGAQP